jgi:hypothetical protein
MSMSTPSFTELLNETKKWLETTYYNQPMVHLGDLPSIKAEQKLSTENQSARLEDFYRVADFSKAEVLTFILSNEKAEVQLIEKMTEAVDKRIAKAAVVKIENLEKHCLWEAFFSEVKSARHILISEVEFYKLPNLLKHYQMQPPRSLFKIPLFFLADLKSYNQDVSLKKSLWQTLLSEL